MYADRFARAQDAHRVRSQPLLDFVTFGLETPQRSTAFLALISAGDIVVAAIGSFHASVLKRQAGT